MKRNGQDATLAAALSYAARGWQVVMLHAPLEGGGCTCVAGKGCESPGKHPRGKEWQNKSTSSGEDTLIALFDKWPESNIGLLLGPRSGLIDVEFDDDEGRATADRLLAECYTPTYKSNRSVHRLFKWTADLPNIQKRVIDGLEIRIGNDDKATQSVLPPSIHPSGAGYEWLAGLTPDDVEPIELPASVLAMLWNVGAGDDKIQELRAPSKAQLMLDGKPVEEGERNNTLYSFACREARRSPNVDDPAEQSHLMQKVRGQNALLASPLDDLELKKIVGSAIAFMRQQRSQAGTQGKGYTIHGLTWDHGEWHPGDWELTVVLSNPPVYRLHVPAWKEMTADGSGNVMMTVDEYRDPARVAAAVQRATRMVVLDDRPEVWPSIWNGRKGKKATEDSSAEPARRGLKAKLLDDAKKEDASPIAKRHVVVAEYLAERVGRAHQSDKPDEQGMPVRVASKQSGEEIWFKWSRVWQDGVMTGQISKTERDDFESMLGVKLKFAYYPSRPAAGESRARYCVLSSSHLDRIRQLAAGADSLLPSQGEPGGDQ